MFVCMDDVRSDGGWAFVVPAVLVNLVLISIACCCCRLVKRFARLATT